MSTGTEAKRAVRRPVAVGELLMLIVLQHQSPAQSGFCFAWRQGLAAGVLEKFYPPVGWKFWKKGENGVD